jgi:hypothetical protein
MRCWSTVSGSRAARVACSWLGCIHTSHPERSTIVAAWPVVVDVRVRDHEQADVLEAQVDLAHRQLEVGERARARACPQSKRTTPWPDATAQALQCGTPGNGNGRRSRQTPGSTRSPRPTSRLRTEEAIGRARYAAC